MAESKYEEALSMIKELQEESRKELEVVLKVSLALREAEKIEAATAAIETVDSVYGTAIEALEKQIPKKPNITLRGTTGWNTEAYCPVCKTMVHSSYCSGCGQAIKWGD